MTTPKLGFLEIAESQASKYLTHNHTLRQIEALFTGVLSRTTAAQPATPAEGDAYILPATPTGAAWASFAADDVVVFANGGWLRVNPYEGLSLNVADDGERVEFKAGAWVVTTSGSGSLVPTPSTVGVPYSDGTDYALTPVADLLFAGGSDGGASQSGWTRWRLYIESSHHAVNTSMVEVIFRTLAGGAQAATGGVASTNGTRITPSGDVNRAFDGDPGTFFANEDNEYPVWVEYEWPVPIDIVEGAIVARSDADWEQAPATGRWEYFDGSVWRTAATFNEPAYGQGETRAFSTVPVPPAPEWWRLNLRDGGADDYFSYAEIEFRTTAGVPESGDAPNAFTSSNFGPTYPASQAFDGLLGGNIWASQVAAPVPQQIGTRYVGGRTPVELALSTISPTYMATEFDVQYSFDSTDGLDGTWSTLTSISLPTPAPDIFVTFALPRVVASYREVSSGLATHYWPMVEETGSVLAALVGAPDLPTPAPAAANAVGDANYFAFNDSPITVMDTPLGTGQVVTGSISMWFNATDVAAVNGHYLFATTNNDGSVISTLLKIEAGGLIRWGHFPRNAGYLDTAAGSVVAGQWHHLVVTVDESGTPEFVIYLDGAEAARGPGVNGGFVGTTDRFIVGGDTQAGGGRDFVGGMSHLKLHNAVMTPAQVAALHAAPFSTGATASGPSVLPDPAVAADDTMMIVLAGRYEAIALADLKAKLDALP